ncbi:MAG TPA: GC-type dockerin domain-anchored protein [Patescibacteria group bacterium]|nr:GC-type dockerin domain-anchored protein [Patescibacteria group bacterium]
MSGVFYRKIIGKGIGLFLSVLFFVFFFRVVVVEAIGLSPPKIDLGEMQNGEQHALSMNLIRGIGEVGDLRIAIEKRGEGGAFVEGEDVLILSENQNLVPYSFVFHPENVEAGDHEFKIDFFPESEDPDSIDGSAGVVIRAGITGVVTYRIAPAPSGGGGGGSSYLNQENETEGEEIVEKTEETSAVAVVEEVPGTEELESSPEIGKDQEETETKTSKETTPVSELKTKEESGVQMKEDLTGDGVVGEQDIVVFLKNFNTKNDLADLNHDGVVDAQDLSISVFHWTARKKVARGISPVAVGPPHSEDGVIFHFQVDARDTQKFDVILASSTDENERKNDYLTFYLLVDTGINGINTADLEIQYDSERLKFVQSDVTASFFDIFPSLPHESESGHLRFLGASSEGFAGTNGFLARLDFLPILGGETRLDFLKVLAFKNQGDAEDVEVLGLRGTLNKITEIPPPEVSRSFSMSGGNLLREKESEFLLKKCFFWIFILILILDVFAVTIWRRLSKKLKKI